MNFRHATTTELKIEQVYEKSLKNTYCVNAIGVFEQL